MLSYIKGTITHVHEQTILVVGEALSIGFEINTSTKGVRLNQSITLYLHTHWNQDQGPSLYGFESIAERDCFRLLINCPGVGPKLALSLLEQITINDLIGLIQANDIKALSSLKGIGTKKAEQLVLYLKNRLDDLVIEHMPESSNANMLKQVTQVLESLHYSRAEIQETLIYLHGQQMGTLPFDTLLRKSLAFLAKKI